MDVESIVYIAEIIHLKYADFESDNSFISQHNLLINNPHFNNNNNNNKGQLAFHFHVSMVAKMNTSQN